MKAGPEVRVLGEGGKGAGCVATPLVREDCRGECTVHPHRSLGTHTLLTVKHLQCCALQTLYGESEVAQQERPGVDEVDPVHGYHDDAVPALEAPGQAVFDEEGVREHKAMLLIPKEDGTLTAGTHLTAEAAYTGLSNHTEELRLPGMLVAEKADARLIVNTHEPWVRRRKRPAPLTHIPSLCG